MNKILTNLLLPMTYDDPLHIDSQLKSLEIFEQIKKFDNLIRVQYFRNNETTKIN